MHLFKKEKVDNFHRQRGQVVYIHSRLLAE